MKNISSIAAAVILTVIFSVNLFFGSGWDIPQQSLTWVLALALPFTLVSAKEVTLNSLAVSLPMLITVSGIAASFAFTLTPYESMPAFFSLLTALGVFLAASAHISSPRRRNLAASLIAVSGGAAAALDLLFYAGNMQFFTNPHIKTAFYFLTLPFAVLMLKRAAGAGKKVLTVFFVSALFLMIFSFALAGSLWGTSILIFSAGLMADKVLGIRIGAAVFVLPLAVAAGGLLAGYDFWDRLYWLTAGLEMITARPLTGFGPGSIPHTLPGFTGGTLSLYIHSFYIQFAAEYGLIAAAGLGFLGARLMKGFNDCTEAAAARVALIALLAYNLLEYNLSIPLIYITASVTAGAFSGSKNLKPGFGKFPAYLIVLLMLFPAGFAAERIADHYFSTRFFVLGMRLAGTGDSAGAAGRFERSLELHNFVPSRLGLAIVKAGGGDPRGAADELSGLYPLLNGGVSHELYLRGLEALGRGETGQASALLTEAAQIRLMQFGIYPGDYL